MKEFPPIKKWDAVRVEWSDPHALAGEWHKPSAKEMSVDGAVTVGLIYKIHSDRVTIVSTRDTVLGQINGGVTIPFVNISKVKKLS